MPGPLVTQNKMQRKELVNYKRAIVGEWTDTYNAIFVNGIELEIEPLERLCRVYSSRKDGIFLFNVEYIRRV